MSDVRCHMSNVRCYMFAMWAWLVNRFWEAYLEERQQPGAMDTRPIGTLCAMNGSVCSEKFLFQPLPFWLQWPLPHLQLFPSLWMRITSYPGHLLRAMFLHIFAHCVFTICVSSLRRQLTSSQGCDRSNHNLLSRWQCSSSVWVWIKSKVPIQEGNYKHKIWDWDDTVELFSG